VSGNNHSQRCWLWLIPILLLALWLAARQLNADVIWNDEWYQYRNAGTGSFAPEPLKNVIINYAIDNGWPPAYGLLMLVWDVFSNGNLYMDRLLSLFFGLLAICVTYQIGTKAASAQVGLCSALILATSTFFNYYLHELRPYSLFVLSTALSIWFYLLIREDHNYQRRWVRWGFGLSLVLAFYTQHMGVASFAGIGFYHLLFERQHKHFWAIFRIGLNAAIVASVWVAVILIAYQLEVEYVRDIPAGTVFYGFLQGYSNGLWWMALLLLASAVLLRKTAVRFLWVWVLIFVGMALLVNQSADFLSHPRHIMGILPILAVLVAIILLEPPHTVSWIIVGIWVGAGIVHTLDHDFMNALPIHIDTIPSAPMNAIYDLAETCFTADDWVVVGVDTPDEEWQHDIPLGYAARLHNFQMVRLSYIVLDNGGKNIGLIDSNMGSTPPERADYITQGQPIWLFTLPRVPLQSEVVAFHHAILERGYTACTPFIDRDDLSGRVYLPAGMSCEQVVAACGR
jgi:hypothetical protein